MGELRNRILNSARRFWATLPIARRHVCCICGKQLASFLPYPGGRTGAPALVRALNVVGSDLDNYECPACGCHDRERHLLLYLRASGLLATMNGARILHLAPERHLRNVISKALPEIHILGDIAPTCADMVQLDVEELPYAAESFDFVIANHLLEHVHALDVALGEIARVLRPRGHAILQTPFSPVLTRTFEDSGIDTQDKRLQAYGQEDHVRLFGRDIVQIVERAGFLSCIRSHGELLPDVDPHAHGVNVSEPFMWFERNAEHADT